jgi:hypothetical protein
MWMLCYAHEHKKLNKATEDRTKAVLLLGTSHAGSDLASMGNWLGVVTNVISGGNVNNSLLADLKLRSKGLLEISKSFTERGEQLIRITSFYEQKPTNGMIVGLSLPW